MRENREWEMGGMRENGEGEGEGESEPHRLSMTDTSAEFTLSEAEGLSTSDR